MANTKNLKPFTSDQSREQAKINGQKGGIKSGEVRRNRKTMREMLNYLLEQEIKNKKGETATTLEAIMLAQIKEAMKGNTKAALFIRDTIGELPTQNVVATNTNINIEDETVVNEVLNKLKEL